MSAVRKIVARSLAGMALVSASLFALPVAPAQAAFDSCNLAIVFIGSSQYRVTVTCTVLNTGADVAAFSLWGEDTFSDDFLLGPIHGASTVVLNTVLDEDAFDSDEVYATVAARDRNGAIHNLRTNTVHGSY